MHVWNVATQLRIARGAGAAAQGSKPVAGGAGDEEQQQQQGAEEDDDEEAARKLPEDATPRKGMLLDFFVILPVMQVRCSTSLDYSFTSQLACFSTWVMTTQ
jgi:cyclic nucleotide gated channel